MCRRSWRFVEWRPTAARLCRSLRIWRGCHCPLRQRSRYPSQHSKILPFRAHRCWSRRSCYSRSPPFPGRPRVGRRNHRWQSRPDHSSCLGGPRCSEPDQLRCSRCPRATTSLPRGSSRSSPNRRSPKPKPWTMPRGRTNPCPSKFASVLYTKMRRAGHNPLRFAAIYSLLMTNCGLVCGAA